jgi:branched-chain amino acid transport system ATP-binding protein
MLEVEHLHVSYGGIPALMDVSVRVDEREFVAIIGRNGAGKSTLLKAIGGFAPVSAGEITFNGISLKGTTPDRRTEMGLGYVMEGRRIFRTLTVVENLRIGGYIHRRDRRKLQAGLQRVFELFPILQAKARSPSAALSGGEQQMLVVGQALMADPQLLVLDEPSAGLAPRITGALFEVLERLHSDGVQILLVEQFVSQALRLSSRGYVLDKGRVVLADRSSLLQGNPAVQDIYMGRGGLARRPADG